MTRNRLNLYAAIVAGLAVVASAILLAAHDLTSTQFLYVLAVVVGGAIGVTTPGAAGITERLAEQLGRHVAEHHSDRPGATESDETAAARHPAAEPTRRAPR